MRPGHRFGGFPSGHQGTDCRRPSNFVGMGPYRWHPDEGLVTNSQRRRVALALIAGIPRSLSWPENPNHWRAITRRDARVPVTHPRRRVIALAVKPTSSDRTGL
jgi:hypothetical protein